jgi:hypothetical protein
LLAKDPHRVLVRPFVRESTIRVDRPNLRRGGLQGLLRFDTSSTVPYGVRAESGTEKD